MITRGTVTIDAPTRLVWDVFSDVEQWPQWTPTVTRLIGLDGPNIAVGKRFEIKQPRMPKLVWEVTEVNPGVSWTWAQRSPGGSAIARHDVVAESECRTLVRQEIDQRGPFGVLVGRLMLRMTRRYLDLEAQGLKARSEQLRSLDGPTA
jgi:uncharacterized membrane protein